MKANGIDVAPGFTLLRLWIENLAKDIENLANNLELNHHRLQRSNRQLRSFGKRLNSQHCTVY